MILSYLSCSQMTQSFWDSISVLWRSKMILIEYKNGVSIIDYISIMKNVHIWISSVRVIRVQITMKKDQKDLGLLVDSGLRWKTHIEKACSKANAVFFQIKRNVSNLSMKTKLELYKSMIVSLWYMLFFVLDYRSTCQVVWKKLRNEWWNGWVAVNRSNFSGRKDRSNLLIELQGSNGMWSNFIVFVVWLGRFAPFAK